MAVNLGNLNWQALSALASGNTVGEQLGNANNVMAGQAEKAQALNAENATKAWLTKTFPGEDFSQFSGPALAQAFNYGLQRHAQAQQPKSAEFKQLDDGTYGAWDGKSFNVLGTAQKPAAIPASVQEYEYAVRTQGFKGTLQDWQKQQAALDDGKTSDRFKTELDTIKTYRSEDAVKTYTATRDGFEKVRSGAQLDSAQGDISLVYGFMKMLDPTSVVREGEFATAQNSGGIPDTVVNAYNRAISGERLTPGQREQFVAAAASQYENTVSNLKPVNKRYSDLANEYGVPTDRVLEQPKEYPPLSVGQKIETTVGGKKAIIERVPD